MESNISHGVLGKICLEIVWCFNGENMADQITRQSPYYLITIKSP